MPNTILDRLRRRITTPLKMEFRGGSPNGIPFAVPPPQPPTSSALPTVVENGTEKHLDFIHKIVISRRVQLDIVTYEWKSEIISGKFDHHDWITLPTLWAKNKKGKHDLDQAGTGDFFIGATNSQTYQTQPNPITKLNFCLLRWREKGLKWIGFTNRGLGPTKPSLCLQNGGTQPPQVIFLRGCNKQKGRNGLCCCLFAEKSGCHVPRHGTNLPCTFAGPSEGRRDESLATS